MISTVWTLLRSRPTGRLQRKDLDDAVYMTKKEKFNAVVEAVKEAHAEADSRYWLVLLPLRLPSCISRMLKQRRDSAQCIECQVP